MNNTKLALFGGNQSISKPFKRYNPIGSEELFAVKDVMESGVLSKFLGAWHEDFYGGPKVQEFEKRAAEYFNVEYAVTVNSWTSGLIAAVGSIGLEPGDEVITTPWTMSATATAILHWNAIPVFADIDPNTYNLDVSSIRKNISPFTKAIVVADIFGQSADMDEIMKLADEYGLIVISDTAQSPGATYKNNFAGTLAHVGGYSLNYHKHIHTGEGGILVTNDREIAENLQLIRNHAEVVVEGKGVSNISNMIGYNFRLGEIECAIGIEQLKKLESLVSSRQDIADKLTDGLSDLPGLQTPITGKNRNHVYYVYAMQVDTNLLGVSRSQICDALLAEGIPISRSYQNIHLLPVYQNKIAFGSRGFPWSSEICRRDIDYQKGICPIAEKLNDEMYIGLGLCNYELEEDDINNIIAGFKKVWSNIDKLKEHYQHN